MKLFERWVFRSSCCFFCIALLSGCVSYRETNDPWLRAARSDFDRKASMFGTVNVSGYQADQWQVWGYVKNIKTGKKTSLGDAQKGFYLILDPGEYRIYLTKLMWMRSGAFIEQKVVNLNKESQIYSVAVGDAVYVGDVMVGVGEPNELNFANPETLVGMALGVVERDLRVSLSVKDLSYQKLEILKNRYSQGGYNFKIQILELP